MTRKNRNISISVVIPAYNRQDELNRAISSVECQSYTPSEIIIVDDCSDPPIYVPDSSVIPIRLYRLDKNSGPYAARNFAIKKSQSCLVAFLDSDDEWLPEKLEHQVRDIRNANRFFSFTEGIVKKKSKRKTWLPYFNLSKPDESALCLGLFESRASFIANSSVLVSRSLLESRSYFREDLIGSDFRMWAEILMFEKNIETKIVYDASFVLNVLDKSVSSNFSKKQRHLLEHLGYLYLHANAEQRKAIKKKTARVLLSVLVRLGGRKFWALWNSSSMYTNFLSLISALPRFILQTLHYLIFVKG